MMTKTLDLNFIRYLNLFEKITKIRTNNCFIFNNTLFFAVPQNLVYRAVGERGNNVKRLSEILRKKVRIIGSVEESGNEEKFIRELIAPIEPKEVQITEKEIIIIPGKINKASLIGRDKTKLKELTKIVNDFFGKILKIQ